MKVSNFQFTNPALESIEFVINEEFETNGEVAIETQIETNVINDKNGEDNAAVELQIIIGSKSKSTPFYICAKEMAYFRWESVQEDDRDRFLRQNAPALLLSYLRPIIAMVTNASKYPAYDLPFIDFTK